VDPTIDAVDTADIVSVDTVRVNGVAINERPRPVMSALARSALVSGAPAAFAPLVDGNTVSAALGLLGDTAGADQVDGGLHGFLMEMRSQTAAPELAQRARRLCHAIQAERFATQFIAQVDREALAIARQTFCYWVASCEVESWRALSENQKRGVLDAILDEAGF
jgi:hypothetical protein